jgi:hypothetical protein
MQGQMNVPKMKPKPMPTSDFDYFVGRACTLGDQVNRHENDICGVVLHLSSIGWHSSQRLLAMEGGVFFFRALQLCSISPVFKARNGLGCKTIYHSRCFVIMFASSAQLPPHVNVHWQIHHNRSKTMHWQN